MGLVLGKIIFNAESEEMTEQRLRYNRRALGGELYDQWTHRYDPHYPKFQQIADNFREYEFRMAEINQQSEINRLSWQLEQAEYEKSSLKSQVRQTSQELEKTSAELEKTQSSLKSAMAGATAGATVASGSTSLMGAVLDSLTGPVVRNEDKRWVSVEAESGSMGGRWLRGRLEHNPSRWYGLQSRGEDLHSYCIMNNGKYIMSIRYDKDFDNANIVNPLVIIEVYPAHREGSCSFKHVRLSSFYRERGSTRRDGILGINHQGGDWYVLKYLNSKGFTAGATFQV